MELCALAGVTRSAYYRWLRNPASISERKNDELAAIAERILLTPRLFSSK